MGNDKGAAPVKLLSRRSDNDFARTSVFFPIALRKGPDCVSQPDQLNLFEQGCPALSPYPATEPQPVAGFLCCANALRRQSPPLNSDTFAGRRKAHRIFHRRRRQDDPSIQAALEEPERA